MNPEVFRDLYDSQLRGRAEVADTDEVTPIGPVFAATFPGRRRGFVTYDPFVMDDGLDELIDAVVSHFEADERVDHFEWKTRGHDVLPRLLQRLEARGFELEEPETVMVGSVDDVIAADEGLPTGYTLERATTEQAMRDAEGLAGRVFGDSPERSRRQGDELVERMRRDPESFEMWFVRDSAGEIVCSGRVDFVDDTDFAGLWGGACDERHRGRGLYRALAAQRARAAMTRGKALLQVDCTEYSRPILQRAGLVAVTTSTPAVWRRPASKTSGAPC